MARHLLMAGRLIEDDPELAHQHALAAGRRAGRIGVVRETVAITAYATGDFALALRELRTYRRLTGRNDELPLMVDSERGVGRPDRALELGRSVPRDRTRHPGAGGARDRDVGGAARPGPARSGADRAADPATRPERAFAWSPALFDAYATVLEELGRDDEAEQWWQRSDRATIALEQAAIPEGEDTSRSSRRSSSNSRPRPEPGSRLGSRLESRRGRGRGRAGWRDALRPRPVRSTGSTCCWPTSTASSTPARRRCHMPLRASTAPSETIRVGYLTNNASRTDATVAAHLTDLGLTVAADDVVTSPQAAVALLAGLVPAGSKILVVGWRRAGRRGCRRPDSG